MPVLPPFGHSLFLTENYDPIKGNIVYEACGGNIKELASRKCPAVEFDSVIFKNAFVLTCTISLH